jgi:hypothetical protein
MISSETAVICRAKRTIWDRIWQGKRASNAIARLTLRAFNSECDAAMAIVRWDNASALEKRMEDTKNRINEHNVFSKIEITDGYFALKLDELRLTNECRNKVEEENRASLKAARSSLEEEKLLNDLKLAEQKESEFRKVLSKAQRVATGSAGFKMDEHTEHIARLERDVAEAQAKVQRARAMAEATQSGYVYILSNVGSFGPGLVKIGLTRRLDPRDMIRELGDDSVPFPFEAHAIIYSDEAPALLHSLHQEFAARRVESTNPPKEFFKASLDQVDAAVRRLVPKGSVFVDTEAQEYRERDALQSGQLANYS